MTRMYALSTVADYNPPHGITWTNNIMDTGMIEPIKTLFGNEGGIWSGGGYQAVTPPFHYMTYRGISRKLLPQVIDGTVNLLLSVRSEQGLNDKYTRLHIWVVNQNTNAVHGVLLNSYQETAAGGATFWPGSYAAKALQSSQTLNPVTIPNDGNSYRLVVEFGFTTSYIGNNTGRTNADARLSNYTIVPDLFLGAAPSNNYAGYFDFSADIQLGPFIYPNMSPETAIDIISLPFSATVVPWAADYDTGFWYKINPVVNTIVSSLVCNSVDIGENIEQYWYTSTNGAPPLPYFYSNYLSAPFQMPFKAGTTYFLKVDIYNPPFNPITFSLLTFINSQIQAGDLLITGDEWDPNPFYPTIKGGTPSVWFAPNGSIRTVSMNIVATELGVNLKNATFGVIGADNNSKNHLFIYSAAPDIVELVRVPFLNLDYFSLASDFNDFYVITQQTLDTTPVTVTKVSPDGTKGTVWTIPGNRVGANILGNSINALSRDSRILYYSCIDYTTNPIPTNVGLRRFDLIDGVALPSFPYPVTGTYMYYGDLLCLKDGSVVAVFYQNDTGLKSNFVIHYASDGTELNRINFNRGPGSRSGIHHIVGTADDSIDKFWIWELIDYSDMTDGSEVDGSKISLISLTDGSVINSFSNHCFLDYVGPLNPSNPCNPERFGAAESCPLMIMLIDQTVPPVDVSVGGVYELVPGRRFDTVITSFVDGIQREDRKIPNPNIQFPLIGS